MNISWDRNSLMAGIGIGVALVYMLDTQKGEKISKKCQGIWNSLTYDNVVSATLTCMGLSLAASFMFPAIHSIFNQAVGVSQK